MGDPASWTRLGAIPQRDAFYQGRKDTLLGRDKRLTLFTTDPAGSATPGIPDGGFPFAVFVFLAGLSPSPQLGWPGAIGQSMTDARHIGTPIRHYKNFL